MTKSIHYDIINRYNHKLVFVTGFYNFFGGNSDLINYINLKIESMADEEGFIFIDISFLNDRYNFFDETQTIWPNMSGYNKIFQIILEKMKLYWYNITSIYYYDLGHGGRRDKNES